MKLKRDARCQELQEFLYFGEGEEFHGMKSYLDFGADDDSSLNNIVGFVNNTLGIDSLSDIDFTQLNPF